MSTATIVIAVILLLILLFGLFMLISLFYLARSQTNRQPPELGADRGNPSPCPQTPNCISTQAPMEAGVNRAEPIVLGDDPAEAFDKIKKWIEQEPRATVAELEDARYLRAEFRSKLFGFVDDLELLVVEEDEKPVLHVRSAARVGRGDMGVNRKRYETLRALLEG